MHLVTNTPTDPKLSEELETYIQLGWKLLPISRAYEGRCSCWQGAACKSPGKHPLISKWKDRATADRRAISSWANTYPDCNWGLALDASTVVIDVDAGGLASWSALQALYGTVPAGPIQQTGSGGLHILFKLPRGVTVKNAVKRAEGLDVRTAGGYIVVAPSNHVSGRRYSWHGGLGSLQTSIPSAPGWLVDWLQGEKPRVNFKEWLSRQEPAVSGQGGSNTTFRIACFAWEQCGIPDAATFIKETSEWNALCVPPWTEAELEHKFTDAQKQSPGAQPGSLPVDLPLKEGRHYFDDLSLVEILEKDPHFSTRITFDVFRGRATIDGRPLEDGQMLLLRNEVMERYGVRNLPSSKFFEAVTTYLAKGKGDRDTLLEYVEDLPRWDGKDRVPELLSQCLHILPTKMAQSYLSKWLISLMARAHGRAKVDTVLILQGPQGYFKSTFLRVLAGDSFFSDQPITLREGSRDNLAKIRGVWVHELAELERVYDRKTVNDAKAFLSKEEDTYRDPYARVDKTWPRRVVFAGTTNNEDILHDATGARRFWILPVRQHIDIAWLKRCRDQVLAQALHAYRAQETWWLDAAQETAHAEASDMFRPVSAFETELLAQLASRPMEVSFTKLLQMNSFYSPSAGAHLEADARAILVNAGYRRLTADRWLHVDYLIQKAAEEPTGSAKILEKLGFAGTRFERARKVLRETLADAGFVEEPGGQCRWLAPKGETPRD